MSQTLMVRFGADTSAAKKAVIDLASTLATNVVSMAASVRQGAGEVDKLSGVLQALPSAARLAVGGFVAFEAASLSVAAVTKAMEEAEKQLARLVKIGSQAQGAGVGTTFLQSWLAQAKSLNLEVTALEGMLKSARSASTVRQGTGTDAASSDINDRLRLQQKAGNISASDVEGVTGQDTQEGRIRAILDLVQRLLDEGKQLAALDIAGKMFGSDFEDKLRSGVDIIGRMKVALDGLTVGSEGRIIPPEEVERAKKLLETQEQIGRVLSDAMRPLHEDIARYGQQEAQSWAETKLSMAEAVSHLMKIYTFATSIRQAFADLGNSEFFKKLRDFMDAKGLLDKSMTIPGIDTGYPKAASENSAGEKPAEGSPLTLKIAPKADKSRNLPSTSKATASAEKETDPVDTFINSIERQTVALKAEIDAYDKSNAVKRVAIDLAKAEEIAKQNGTKLTDAQTQRIREASTATANYKDKLVDLEQQQRLNAEAARFFGDTLADSLGDAIFSGTKLTDIIKSLSSQLGRQSLSALISGTGPLAGIFGTSAKASEGSNSNGGLVGLLTSASKESGASDWLSSIFSGFRANGGAVQAGRSYRVNELGEEWFVPSVDGRIVPRNNNSGSGAGNTDTASVKPLVVQFNVTASDAPSFTRSEAQITGMLARAVKRGSRGM